MKLANLKYLSVLSLALCPLLPLDGQSTISGLISDSRGEGLVGANVYLEGTYDGASSNASGKFSLISEEEGRQILCIEYIGYENYKTELNLDGSDIHLPPVRLEEEFNELTAVTITAGTFEAGDKKKAISLSSLDMLTTAGSAGDVFGALQSLPGTSTVGESGKLFVKDLMPGMWDSRASEMTRLPL